MARSKTPAPERLALSCCSEIPSTSVFDPYQTFNSIQRGGSRVMPYGKDNQFPNWVYKSIQTSPTASSCRSLFIHALRGQGLEYEGHSRPNLSESWDQVISRCFSDFLLYHSFALRVCRNIDHQSVSFFSQPWSQLRISPDRSTAAVTLDWSHANKVVTFPIFNGKIEEGKEYVMLFQDLDDTELFYSYYISSLAKLAESEADIVTFYEANLDRGFQPKVMLSLPYQPSNFKQFTTELKQCYAGVENADKMLIVASDGEAVPTFTAIPQVDLDRYRNIASDIENKIITFFGCPKSLIGKDSNAGFSNKAEGLIAEWSIFEKLHVSYIRDFVLNVFNGFHDTFQTPIFSISPLDIRSYFETGVTDESSQDVNKGEEIEVNSII